MQSLPPPELTRNRVRDVSPQSSSVVVDVKMLKSLRYQLTSFRVACVGLDYLGCLGFAQWSEFRGREDAKTKSSGVPSDLMTELSLLFGA
jgi:hypothetical protein